MTFRPRLRFHAALAGAFLLGAIGPALADSDTPVMVGGTADLDACLSFGEVTGLNPDGDGFLAVRTGPGTENEMIDKLTNGHPVFSCDQHGAWIGIVYSPDGGTNCEVSSPIPRRAAYAGPCRSGWVHSKYVRILAG